MVAINKKLKKVRSHNIKFADVNLQKQNLDQLVEDQGVRVRLYKTLLCPNVKSMDGGQHNINCKICDNGFIDKNPLDTWALLQSQTQSKNFPVEGSMDDMSVSATFLSDIDVQYFAKVELLDYTTQFFEVVQRQEGEVDHLRYPAHTVNIVVDKNGVEYYLGTDFKLSPTKDIQWTSDHRPPQATPYSIHYDYLITYRAVQAFHINRFANVTRKQNYKEPIHLNQQWLIKRDFHIARRDLDENLLENNQVFQYDNN